MLSPRVLSHCSHGPSTHPWRDARSHAPPSSGICTNPVHFVASYIRKSDISQPDTLHTARNRTLWHPVRNTLVPSLGHYGPRHSLRVSGAGQCSVHSQQKPLTSFGRRVSFHSTRQTSMMPLSKLDSDVESPSSLDSAREAEEHDQLCRQISPPPIG